MFFAHFVFAAALSTSALALHIGVRQDSAVGQPVSVGLAANRTAPANETFGTANATINWTNLPKTLCVVPIYAKDAGITNDTETLLITQQALEICPQATSIVCANSNTTTTNSTSEA
ncbi:unnamed protein product [Rhizoctonia solani]|uniref:Uncharacterized protein n=3 Tax=Rhizoctonia solani TaxID=456999 RepID=A0A8H3B3D6_9AGAM|nr:hypothetical protein RSOL_497720 [Rhizoctonia solani AG-3 Rhs1AP]KEP49241.1 hypothetical protein V565_104490 [Rhizoctonia solani 123E]CAE6362975.1 unnamed protein product [Rhizoctonia solani]CAE6447058.1 unnamed protein product [Rhizoctonia solani]